MYIEESQIKKFLLDAGLVYPNDLEDVLLENLVTEGKISADDFKRAQAYVVGIPFVDLRQQTIPFDILAEIPEPIARNNNIVAYGRDDDAHTLEIALLDTKDLRAINFLKEKQGYTLLPRLAAVASIKNALIQYQKGLQNQFGALIQKRLSEKEPQTKGKDVFETLLKHATLQHASDIHIEPQEDLILVRYRIGGTLSDAMSLPKEILLPVTQYIKTVAGLAPSENSGPQMGKYKLELDGETALLRISIVPTLYGEKTVLRILHGGNGFSLETIGLQHDNLETVHGALKQKEGLVLVSGPVNSGVSTTLYTMTQLLNMPSVNVATVEDPIEYEIPRVNQVQVNETVGFDMAESVRSVMQQDPDVIMIGDISSSDVSQLACNAAVAGRLVLGGLQEASVAEVIQYMQSTSIPTFTIASALKVVIAQRLVRKLGSDKEAYTLSKSGIISLSKSIDLEKVLKVLKKEKIVKKDATWAKINFYRPKQSKAKQIVSDGYDGFIGLQEVLPISSTIKTLIQKEKVTIEQISKQAEKEGMITLTEDGVFKAVQGLTTLEEVLEKSLD